MFGEDQYVVYTVKAGDTLNGIGALYGVSAADIAKANMLTDMNKITVGMELMIPEIYTAPASSTPASSTPAVSPGIMSYASGAVKTPAYTIKPGTGSPVQTSWLNTLTTGTLFGIPKLYAYGAIAAVTAAAAYLIVKAKKGTSSTTIGGFIPNPFHKKRKRRRSSRRRK